MGNAAGQRSREMRMIMNQHICEPTSPWLFPFARSLLRWLFALVFVFSGYKHITAPDGFVAITPRWVPLPDFVVWATGWCEIAGAAGLLVPKRWSPGAYRGASIALAAYALCVWPANFNHALHDNPVAGVHLSWWYHGPRLVFQPMLIWAILWAGHIIDWPFGRPHR
jgi:uncharacterized membrane protein